MMEEYKANGAGIWIKYESIKETGLIQLID